MKIAVMTRTLNTRIQVICRCSSRAYAEELNGLGSVSVLDPFEIFANKLCTALHRPLLHTLDEWLIGAPGVTLDQRLGCPLGHWIVCGYGRMGRWLDDTLRARGVATTVIDPELTETAADKHKIRGAANRSTLRRAGMRTAVGVIAATNHDTVNLRVVLLARALNPKAFVVVRQNYHKHEVAFAAAQTDLIMQPSLVTARRILLKLISPLIQTVLDYLESCPPARLEAVYRRVSATLVTANPVLWVVDLSRASAPALADPQTAQLTPITLADVTRNPSDRTTPLSCLPLALRRGRRQVLLPEANYALQTGDQVLFCGTRQARALLDATLHNVYTLRYLVTGREQPRGYLLNRLLQ